MRRLLPFVLMLGLAGAGTPASAAPDAQMRARVDGGAVQGIAHDGILAFKGIPYAAAPVGPLRWRAPQPAPTWGGVRPAAAFGHDCMQVPFPSDAAPLGTPPAEDCLYLNVWRPAQAGARRPVLVWIHGGGFVNGGSSPAVYDGSAFARQGLVFVSFNYRLGRFGFFAHPALSAANEGPLGNYGLLDQIAALQWVRRNITAFGGDPDRVTLIGESAGGVAVLDLMASPMAKGLFQQGVVMSGGGRSLLPQRPLRGGDAALPSAEQVGLNFAQGAGIDGQGPGALARLRALPAEIVRGDLNMATMMPSGPPTYVGGPVIDGQLVTGSTEAAMNQGSIARIPLMIGTTGADIGFGSAPDKTALFATFGAAAAAARAAYDPTGTGDLADLQAAVFRDRMMTEPARFVATRMDAAGAPAWLYRFSYVATSMRSAWKGAPHATDIPYFFDTVAAKYGAALSADDARAAHIANSYLAAFALTGKPAPAGQPAWPAFHAATDMILDISPGASPQVGTDPWRARLDLHAALAPAS